MDGVSITRVGPGDAQLLAHVLPNVFDNPIDPRQLAAFLTSRTHIMVVALSAGAVVGVATGTILLHPDKQPMLFINEVGVAETFQRKGIGRAITERLIAEARNDGCSGAWLATEEDNLPARALYHGMDGRETPGIVVFDWDHPDL